MVKHYDPRLKLYMPFESELVSKIVDVTGYGNHGTLYNDITRVAGKFGQGIQFGGVTSYASIPHDVMLNPELQDFSVSLWMKSSQTVSNNYLAAKFTGENRWFVRGESTNKMTISLKDGTNNAFKVSSGVFFDGELHHFVATVDRDSSTGIKIYRDSVFDGQSDPTAVGTIVPTDPLVLGDFTAGGNLRYIGMLDEFRFYKGHILSQNEINMLYRMGKIRYMSIPNIVKSRGYPQW